MPRASLWVLMPSPLRVLMPLLVVSRALFSQVRLAKVMRVLRLQKGFAKLREELAVNPAVMQLVTMLVYILFFMHIVGCVWFGITAWPKWRSCWGHSWPPRARQTATREAVNLEPGRDKLIDFAAFDHSGITQFFETSWASSYPYGANGTIKDDAEPPAQYLASIYWAFTTISTIGYGDIVATNDAEKLLSVRCFDPTLHIDMRTTHARRRTRALACIPTVSHNISLPSHPLFLFLSSSLPLSLSSSPPAAALRDGHRLGDLRRDPLQDDRPRQRHRRDRLAQAVRPPLPLSLSTTHLRARLGGVPPLYSQWCAPSLTGCGWTSSTRGWPRAARRRGSSAASASTTSTTTTPASTLASSSRRARRL